MKRLAFAIVALCLVVSMAPVSNAQSDWWIYSRDVYQNSIYNVFIKAMNYDSTEQALSIHLWRVDNPWNVGLGLVLFKFNYTQIPQVNNVYLMINNETITEPIDMLKNYTIEQGEYLNHLSRVIYSCWFVEIFFYTYVDHHIENESQFWTAFDTGWNDSAWASQFPNYDPLNPYWDNFNGSVIIPSAMALAEETQDTIVVDVGFDQDTTGSGLPFNMNSVIIGLTAGMAVAVVVLFIILRLKHR